MSTNHCYGNHHLLPEILCPEDALGNCQRNVVSFLSRPLVYRQSKFCINMMYSLLIINSFSCCRKSQTAGEMTGARGVTSGSYAGQTNVKLSRLFWAHGLKLNRKWSIMRFLEKSKFTANQCHIMYSFLFGRQVFYLNCQLPCVPSKKSRRWYRPSRKCTFKKNDLHIYFLLTYY